jgi:transposase, IS5 family
VVVRPLVLKHARNRSYVVLEREVRANLIYRKFTHIGMAKMADAKTMGKWGVAVGPEVIKQIHDRIVSIAKEKGLAHGKQSSLAPPRCDAAIA